ncbi:CapA family protein [bacterium]|nr:CapA family protein [bacterium]
MRCRGFYTILLLALLFARAVAGVQTIADSLIVPNIELIPIIDKMPRLPLPIINLPRPIFLTAVGDLMMGGSARSVISRRGVDYPFDSTRTVLMASDVAIANLEAPFTCKGIAFKKKYTFRVPATFADGILRSGIDVLTLANNHILDYGAIGLRETVSLLDSIGLAHCGAGENLHAAEEAAILEVNGKKIGCIAFSLTYPAEFWATSMRPGTAYPRLNRLKLIIESLENSVDYIVVSFHWGGELMISPKPYQRMYAKNAIDWGADLVLGHHPHVLQGCEWYKERLIAYSLGNYVFGSYNNKVHNSVILKVLLDDSRIIYSEIIPIIINNYKVQFQPRILQNRKRQDVISLMNGLSKRLNGGRDIFSSTGILVIPVSVEEQLPAKNTKKSG